MSGSLTANPRRKLLAAAICAVLLAIFAILSYSAAWQKSATWDEPEHLLGSFIHRHYKDFRINPEDPALFGWIASLPLRKDALKVSIESSAFRRILDDTAWQWPFIWETLYRTGGNDPEPLLRRARFMSTLVGVLLGATLAWWTYQLAGSAAAIVATALYAFCPNFLAHSSLVKNDVMLSAALLGLMFAVWRFGRRGTWLNLSAVALLTGAAVSVKYSGVLAGPIVAIALVVRAMLPQPWRWLGMELTTRLARLGMTLATCVVVAIVAYVFVWACYGFRFAATPDPTVGLNVTRVVVDAKRNEILAALAREQQSAGQVQDASYSPTTAEIDAHQPSAPVRMVLWLERERLLPQAWLMGFLYTYKSTLIRSSYLLGDIRITGWWYFFLLAMLFKTPTATLAAALAALFSAPLVRLRRRNPEPRFVDWWALVCLVVAPALYGMSALSTNLNLGLRHVLPIYPFIFIGAGIVLGRLIVRWRVVGKILAGVLAFGLVAETLGAYPDYVAFFNTPSGESRGGLRLLGDSNLDWGQDLTTLAEWQRRYPSRKLYLSYFGVADPEYYGVTASHLPGGYIFAQPAQIQLPDPREPSVLAISATNLQGIYLPDQLKPSYDELRKYQPFEVLGGSIYLYEFPVRTPTTTTR